ncbi:hypothetical protein RN51_00876 [Microbacterium oxydans]|uniref:Uncharacterized protein n=1 Tax=Microbacterium oxydans TaxID=82380 RepID=A0A0F0KV01_9MICO|nr:hypothetical protein RN51_00876 [Microbacterium oxydans]
MQFTRRRPRLPRLRVVDARPREPVHPVRHDRHGDSEFDRLGDQILLRRLLEPASAVEVRRLDAGIDHGDAAGEIRQERGQRSGVRIGHHLRRIEAGALIDADRGEHVLGHLDERQQGRGVEDRLLTRDPLARIVVVPVDLELMPPARDQQSSAQHHERPDRPRLRGAQRRITVEGGDRLDHPQRPLRLVMQHRCRAHRQFGDAPAEPQVTEVEHRARVQP